MLQDKGEAIGVPLVGLHLVRLGLGHHVGRDDDTVDAVFGELIVKGKALEAGFVR